MLFEFGNIIIQPDRPAQVEFITYLFNCRKDLSCTV